MKRVGIREFKDRVTTLIAEEKALVIEKRGRAVGFYIPLAKKDVSRAKEETEKLEHVIADILERTGMTREAFEAAWEEAGVREPRA
jgi:hypothetical protein